jgi:hypothetical protein
VSEELIRDALDHIMRVACAAREPTARLDWIAARAKRALAGKPYDQEELPKYPKMAPPHRRREPRDFTERGGAERRAEVRTTTEGDATTASEGNK